MITAFFRSLSEFFNATPWMLIIKSVILTSGLFILLNVAVWYGLTLFQFMENALHDSWLDIGLGFVSFMLSIFLFPLILPVTLSFFLDEVAVKVEERHYPGLPEPVGHNMTHVILASLKLVGAMLVLHAIASPVYLFIPVLNVILFYLISGYLVGREFFELVATRHMTFPSANEMRRKHKGTIIFGGAVIAFLLTLPVVNLVAPIIGVTMMVHYFHQLSPSFVTGVTKSQNRNNSP